MTSPYQKYSILQVSNDTESATAGYKFITAPPESQIQDARGLNDFKQLTIGGHKRSDAISGIDKALGQGHIEMACYWSIQLLCSGVVNQLWDKLMTYAFKQINIACPSLPQWLASKNRIWQRMITGKKEFSKGGILHIRNLQQFRNIIAEVVVVLCQARKRKIDTCSVKITDQDFIVATFASKCVARKTNYLAGLVGANDTQEVIIAANEFYHHLLNKDIDHALYWLHWILQWEKQNIRRFKSFQVQSRQIPGISDAHQRDVMWLIWSIFHQVRQRMLDSTRAQSSSYSSSSSSNFSTSSISTSAAQISYIETQLNALWDMYIQDWKPGAKTRKLPLLIWSIQYLVYPLDWSIPVIPSLSTFVKVNANINKMYTKIAQSQGTNYCPPGSQHPGSTLDTIIQNNYLTPTPTHSITVSSPSYASRNPISIDASPAPPLQINTQRMMPTATTHTSTSLPNSGNRSSRRVNNSAATSSSARNKKLSDDERVKMGWMNIVLQ